MKQKTKLEDCIMKKWVTLFLSILMLSSLLVTAASAEPVTLVFKALTWIAD